jgi:hypothetical protein
VRRVRLSPRLRRLRQSQARDNPHRDRVMSIVCRDPRTEGRPGQDQGVKPAPRGRDALDNISHAIALTESGDEHFDKDGKVKISPKGAIGVGQFMPGTAKDRGIDPYDEAQNRAEIPKLAGELFDKYGNWDDALAAYNWGPGNVDKWIARGRNEDQMPAETKNYISDTIRRAGMSETSATSPVKAKRLITEDDWKDIEATVGRPISSPGPEDETILRFDAEVHGRAISGCPGW